MLKVKAATEAGSNHNGQTLLLKDALRIGMWGIGRAGFKMVRQDVATLPCVRVIGGYDLLPERTQQLAELCNAEMFTDQRHLLDDERIELIVIATRSHEHVPLALQAMKAGKDVLVEKPMALDIGGADKLIATASKLGRRLFVRHNRRFDPQFLHAMEIVRSGKLGKLFSVQLRQGGYQRRADWQTLKKYGGGQMLNWGPHLVDWAMQFVGGKAVDVWADLKLIAAVGDAEDHVKLLIRGDTGVTADIEISGAAALGQHPWHLLGSHGSLTIDSKDQCRLRYFDPKRMAKVKASDQTPIGTAGSHFSGGEDIEWIEEHFEVAPKKRFSFWTEMYKSIRKGAEFPITLEQARENMRVISLAKKGSGF